jgi:hypothetical protein
MEREIDHLLEVTKDVVDQEAFEAIGLMTLDELCAQVKRDTDAGRFQAMGARRYAFLAKYALEAGNVEEARRQLDNAKSRWIQALEANCDPRKIEKRLTRLPEPPGGRVQEKSLRLHEETTRHMESGCGKLAALRKAVTDDPYLAEAFRKASDDTLKKNFDRTAKRIAKMK